MKKPVLVIMAAGMEAVMADLNRSIQLIRGTHHYGFFPV